MLIGNLLICSPCTYCSGHDGCLVSACVEQCWSAEELAGLDVFSRGHPHSGMPRVAAVHGAVIHDSRAP